MNFINSTLILIIFFGSIACQPDRDFLSQYKASNLTEIKVDSIQIEMMILNDNYWKYIARSTGNSRMNKPMIQLKIQDNRKIRHHQKKTMFQKFDMEKNILKNLKITCNNKQYMAKTIILESLQEQFIFDSYLIEFDPSLYTCVESKQIQITDNIYQIDHSFYLK